MPTRALSVEAAFAGPSEDGVWPAVLALADTPFRPRGSEADETIPASLLRDAAAADGHRLRDSVLLGHPSERLSSYPDAFGDVEALREEDGKLVAGIRLSEARTPAPVARALVSGRPVQVSVGVDVGSISGGQWGGSITLDHVAVLPGGGAAFSQAGVGRAAEEEPSMTPAEISDALKALDDDERSELLASFAPPPADDPPEEPPAAAQADAESALTSDERRELEELRADLRERQDAERRDLTATLVATPAYDSADQLADAPLDHLRALAAVAKAVESAGRTEPKSGLPYPRAMSNSGQPTTKTRYAPVATADWRQAQEAN